MASNKAAHAPRYLTTEEVIEGVFTDKDSEDKFSDSEDDISSEEDNPNATDESESVTESDQDEEIEQEQQKYSHDKPQTEQEENSDISTKSQTKYVSSQEDQQPSPKRARVSRGRGCRVRGGGVRGRGVRRRGGNRSRATANLSQVKAAKEAEKERKELVKENFWKRDDHPVTIPQFTGDSKINIIIEDGTQPLEIVSFFLDDDFYEQLVTQTNLYANQYHTEHSMLPRFSRARP